MNVKDRLTSQLTRAREYSEGLLASFQTPEEWTHQVHANANHALWFVGHMGMSDNFFISRLDPAKTKKPPPGYEERFGVGSKPVNNPDEYPPVDDVLSYMRDRRSTLLSILGGLSEPDLGDKLAESTAMLPDRASVFEMAIWHEGLHSGQLSVCRRSMGHQPLMQPPPAASNGLA